MFNNSMKQLTIILLSLIGVAYGQSQPTSSKTRFVNGLYMGTKLDSYFNPADSNALYWRADSVVMAKYKGTARALAFAVSGGYIPYSDTTSLLSQVVRTFGTQTVGGDKTFSNDIVVNGARVGRKTARNLVFGDGALNANPTGPANTAIGDTALFALTTGNSNTAIGWVSLANVTTGSFNIGVGTQAAANTTTGQDNFSAGSQSLLYNTTGSSNIAIGGGAGAAIGVGGTNAITNESIYIGSNTKPQNNNQTNQVVIGHNVTGNGSNTVTIGNSSVTDNYFSGNVRAVSGTAFLKNMANGNVTDSLLVSTNGEVRKIKGDSAYVNLSTDQTIAGFKTFTSNVDIASTFRSTAANAPLVGSGLEFLYNGADGIIQAYNRSGAAYLPLILEGSTTTINSASGGNIILDANVFSDGVYNATVGGTNRDVFVDNTGLIGYVSSFRASKKNIAPLSKTDWLHKLNPVTFNYRIKDSTGKYTDSAYKEKEYGLVAEEVETVNPEMVFYDVDSTGKHLRGVHYSKLIIPLLKEIQDQKKRIDAQQTAIEALIKRIELLEKR